MSAYPDNVPSVYLQWRMQRRHPIKFGILDVTLGPRRSELATPQVAGGGFLSLFLVFISIVDSVLLT